MKAYPAGWLFWKELARAGVPIGIQVKVLFDPEARVYVAGDSNLRGLNAEASTLEGLFREIDLATDDLLRSYLSQPPARRPVTRFTLEKSAVA